MPLQPDTDMRQVIVNGLTADQEAMLDLLGNPAQIATDARTYVEKSSDGPPVMKHFSCPVVNVLGNPRTILPNGDVQSKS